MRNALALILPLFVLCACAGPQVPATKLEAANVLPITLDDRYQFRKQKLDFFDDETQRDVVTQSEAAQFIMAQRRWGALDNLDLRQRAGNYYSFFWRTNTGEDVTVRLEYRQAGLGNYVMAQERYYPAAKGSYQSNFQVIGDDYLENGRVTAWRALLIVDGKIVGLTQSYIWR